MPIRSTSRIFAALFGALICAAVLAAPAAFASGMDTPSGVTSLPFNIQGARIMTLTQTGLGIGASATSPTEPLEINGNILINGNDATGELMLGSCCQSTLYRAAADGSLHIVSGQANIELTPASNVIVTQGNLGIGVTTPQRTLDVSTSGQITFGDNVTASNTATGIYWHSVTPNGSPDTAGTYGIFRTPGAWSGNYAQLEMEFPTGIIIDGGSCCSKSGTEIQPNGGNVGIGKYPAAPLDVNGGIRGNSSGTVAGDACSPEGMLAYDMTNHQPVYCSSGGTWSASFMPGFTNRTWHGVGATGTNNFSYPVEISTYCRVAGSAGSLTMYSGSNLLSVCTGLNGSQDYCQAYATIPPGQSWSIGFSSCGAAQAWELY
jgi:hypothetical protein